MTPMSLFLSSTVANRCDVTMWRNVAFLLRFLNILCSGGLRCDATMWRNVSFLLRFLNVLCSGGFFIEAGAHNGEDLSNTLFLEVRQFLLHVHGERISWNIIERKAICRLQLMFFPEGPVLRSFHIPAIILAPLKIVHNWSHPHPYCSGRVAVIFCLLYVPHVRKGGWMAMLGVGIIFA